MANERWREYVDVRFKLQNRALKTRLKADHRALVLAQTTLERRLEGLNELRGNVITKEEFNIRFDTAVDRINRLENFQARLIGIGLVLVIVSGLIGAGIMRLLAR